MVDASVAAKWVIPEAESDLAVLLRIDARASDKTVVGPPHLLIETTNTIRKRVVQGHDEHSEAFRRLLKFEHYGVRVMEPPELYRRALELAEEYRRPTVYDAHYIVLAETLGCDFWTADYRLINALNGRLPFVRALREFQT